LPEEMEDDGTGRQGPQRIVVLEKADEEDEKKDGQLYLICYQVKSTFSLEFFSRLK
jgi:hypothetical protein